jgi:hypothetical protein
MSYWYVGTEPVSLSLLVDSVDVRLDHPVIHFVMNLDVYFLLKIHLVPPRVV